MELKLRPGDICIADMPSGPVVGRFLARVSARAVKVDVAGAHTTARDAWPYTARLSNICTYRGGRRHA